MGRQAGFRPLRARAVLTDTWHRPGSGLNSPAGFLLPSCSGCEHFDRENKAVQCRQRATQGLMAEPEAPSATKQIDRAGCHLVCTAFLGIGEKGVRGLWGVGVLRETSKETQTERSRKRHRPVKDRFPVGYPYHEKPCKDAALGLKAGL